MNTSIIKNEKNQIILNIILKHLELLLTLSHS